MIDGVVTGSDQVNRAFGRVTPAVRAELVKGTGRIVLRLLTKVKLEKLSGQVLKVRTGRLRRSINQRVDASGDLITGSVGTNVDYGRKWELGFKGTESVQQHMRTIKQAFGKPLKGGPKQISVRAHTRRVNLPERSFLRSALQELAAAGVIEAEYSAAVAAGLRSAGAVR